MRMVSHRGVGVNHNPATSQSGAPSHQQSRRHRKKRLAWTESQNRRTVLTDAHNQMSSHGTCSGREDHPTVHYQLLSRHQVDLLVGQMHANLSKHVMDRDPAFSSMLAHLRLAFIRIRKIQKSGYFASIFELRPVSRCYEARWRSC